MKSVNNVFSLGLVNIPHAKQLCTSCSEHPFKAELFHMFSLSACVHASISLAAMGEYHHGYIPYSLCFLFYPLACFEKNSLNVHFLFNKNCHLICGGNSFISGVSFIGQELT